MNTLLVVEDEKLIRQGIVAMIRRSSVPVEEILECRNGEEALEILRKQRVDVMFTDIRMPKSGRSDTGQQNWRSCHRNLLLLF